MTRRSKIKGGQLLTKGLPADAPCCSLLDLHHIYAKAALERNQSRQELHFHRYLLAYEVKTNYINPRCSLGYQSATWPLAYLAFQRPDCAPHKNSNFLKHFWCGFKSYVAVDTFALLHRISKAPSVGTLKDPHKWILLSNSECKQNFS